MAFRDWIKASGEGLLLILVTTTLYLLALINFPIFSEDAWRIFREDFQGFFPISTMGVAAASVTVFALAGALLAHWAPTLSWRSLSWFWVAMYLVFWANPAAGLALEMKSIIPLLPVLSGVVALGLIFKLLGIFKMEGQVSLPLATWRSRFAKVWLVIWMGFLLGLSSVLISSWKPPHHSHFVLGIAAMLLSVSSYRLVERLRVSEGGTIVEGKTAWKWMLGTWAFLVAAYLTLRFWMDAF